MSENYKDTKQNLKDWMKVSWNHLKVIKDSFLLETKKLIDEAREEFKKEQEEKERKSTNL